MRINNLSTIAIITPSAGTPSEITYGTITSPTISNEKCKDISSFNDVTKDTSKKGNNKGKTICPDVLINLPDNGTKTFTENNNIDVSKVYSTVDLKFTGNLNKTGSLELYAKSLDISKNFNNVNNLTIETKHNFKVGSNVQNTDRSNFYIGGILHINGHLDLNASKVLIRGTRTQSEKTNSVISKISGKLNINDSSQMCINGDLQVKDALTITKQNGLIYKR